LFFRMLFAKADTYSERYRHEYKYEISNPQIEILCCRLSQIMNTDRYAGESGVYEVRSLYFDDYANTCYYENEAGVDVRDKYRIRIYNEDYSHISLEKKSKKSGMTHKQSYAIDRKRCEQLMLGRYDGLLEVTHVGLQGLLLEMCQRFLRPVVIVEYIRFPFVEKNGNIRITFDEFISSSNDIENFLEPEIITRPIMRTGESILEVKWDEFLPDYIKSHLQMDSLQRESFSKYYLCRKYNIYGGIKA